MKAALVGALRREKMAETTIQRLKVEIDGTKCLVCIIVTAEAYA
jgi:kinesin family protein 15